MDARSATRTAGRRREGVAARARGPNRTPGPTNATGHVHSGRPDRLTLSEARVSSLGDQDGTGPSRTVCGQMGCLAAESSVRVSSDTRPPSRVPWGARPDTVTRDPSAAARGVRGRCPCAWLGGGGAFRCRAWPGCSIWSSACCSRSATCSAYSTTSSPPRSASAPWPRWSSGPAGTGPGRFARGTCSASGRGGVPPRRAAAALGGQSGRARGVRGGRVHRARLSAHDLGAGPADPGPRCSSGMPWPTGSSSGSAPASPRSCSWPCRPRRSRAVGVAVSILAAIYPLFDVVLLLILLNLAFTTAARQTSFRLLVAMMVAAPRGRRRLRHHRRRRASCSPRR